MRILLLAHGFNGLTQRLFCELRADGHEVSVEFDIADSVTGEAVASWRPEVVVAPYLKRRIPASVWQRVPCLVVHPGPPGDRGPAALDWAILDGAREWGVTVLEATGDYDAGAVWAARGFAMRSAPKSSLYRNEVTQAAVAAVREALDRGGAGARPVAARPIRPMPTAAQRAIDWAAMDSAEVLRRIHSADGHPGLADTWFGRPLRLFDAHAASADALLAAAGGAGGVRGVRGARGASGAGGAISANGAAIARRGPALLRRTRDGGVWIGHLRDADPGLPPLKRPAVDLLAAEAAALPELPAPLQRDPAEWDELHYEEFGPDGARVGWLSFDFHNGAMSAGQCLRLRDALRWQRRRPTPVLVLAGGSEFFGNGIHLHDIEAAAHRAGDSAADASMRNIEAIDDVVLEILEATDRLTVAALRGNAGAGGCFVALAADLVWAHGGVVLNPHYKNMGNLYGSEYWTYTLPRRLGTQAAAALMQGRLPIAAPAALRDGLIDAVLAPDAAGFDARVRSEALALAQRQNVRSMIDDKHLARRRDEALRPLADHRAAELQHMQRNFYGFDASYHVARHHFVHRKPASRTPLHLALHRR